MVYRRGTECQMTSTTELNIGEFYTRVRTLQLNSRLSQGLKFGNEVDLGGICSRHAFGTIVKVSQKSQCHKTVKSVSACNAFVKIGMAPQAYVCISDEIISISVMTLICYTGIGIEK